MPRITIIALGLVLGAAACGDRSTDGHGGEARPGEVEATRERVESPAELADRTGDNPASDTEAADTAADRAAAGETPDEAAPAATAGADTTPDDGARGTRTEADTAQASADTGASGTEPAGGAGDRSELGIWDDDPHIRISRREFLRAVTADYPMWSRFDSDHDGSVSRGELVAGLYDAWRGDGPLTADEVRQGAALWLNADWPAEGLGEGVVSRARLDRLLDRHAAFEALDRDEDGSLDTFEMGLAFFAQWDRNGDGYIDEAEWHRA